MKNVIGGDIFDKYLFTGPPLSITIKVFLSSCLLYVFSVLTGLVIAYFGYYFGGNSIATTLEFNAQGHHVKILISNFMAWHLTRLSEIGRIIGIYSWLLPLYNEKQIKVADKKIVYDKTYDGSDLIEWINSSGGYIHPNARIGLDPTGQYRGVFVKNVGEDGGGTADGIEEDDIICKIPWDLIVKPRNYHYHDFDTNCDALREMYHQFQLGDRSRYAPYINYLKNQPAGRIPSDWSAAGKQLLRRVLDQEGEAGLPPFGSLDRFAQVWMGECKGEDTPLARAAFFQFTSRDEDTLMVPFYDMHNHSNDPKKLNTIVFKPEKKGKPFTMRATRDILPGEQILISYNRCHGCWFDEDYNECKVRSHDGTDHLFRQFGFVEDYPQFWKISQYDYNGKWLDDVVFCLERDDDDDELFVRRFGDNYSNEEDEIPRDGNVDWFKKHLKRLKRLKGLLVNDEELMKSMPRYEWEMTWAYHEALLNAMSTAVRAVKVEDDSSDDDSDDKKEDDSSDDDSDDDSEDNEIVMAFVEDVIMPVIEGESMDDSEDRPLDDSYQPDLCIGNANRSDDESEDYEDDYMQDEEEEVVAGEKDVRKKLVLKGTNPIAKD